MDQASKLLSAFIHLHSTHQNSGSRPHLLTSEVKQCHLGVFLGGEGREKLGSLYLVWLDCLVIDILPGL